MKDTVDVLNLGYVRLVNNMGSDLDVVNAARASFEKEVSELSEKDKKLISFLVRDRHDSCFRHCVMTFEVYAPLMVARQWWKHAVASTHLDDQMGWNETSRRYVTEYGEFYIPDHFLSKPDNAKQGAGEKVPESVDMHYANLLSEYQERGLELYEMAMNANIAPEQARLFLPAYGMYVRWRWTTSLNAVLNFLELRLGHGAQSEIVKYAEAVESFVEVNYPETLMNWRKRVV